MLDSKPEHGVGVVLPPPAEWKVESYSLAGRWTGGAVRLSYESARRNFLLRSPAVPVAGIDRLELSPSVEVEIGMLGLGVLSRDGRRFLGRTVLGAGAHRPVISASIAGEDSVWVVLYSAAEEGLRATVDWTGQIDLTGPPNSKLALDTGQRDACCDATAIPPLIEWTALAGARWIDDGRQTGLQLKFDERLQQFQFVSPYIELEGGHTYTFAMNGAIAGEGNFALMLIEQAGALRDARYPIHREIRSNGGEFIASFAYTPNETRRFRLALAHGIASPPAATTIVDPRLTVSRRKLPAEVSRAETATYLAHWGWLRRRVHDLCKRFRTFNALVAAIEMRLGHEEIVSLPMFLSLCPTGQCNALCDFCSVTINRTGIVKRELPWDKLERFLRPTLGTIYMYGVEGNGEPTLYRQFDELTSTLARNGADAYLITNGSRIRPEQIPLLLTYESITFSLNARTAETHRRVMKLKDFDHVTSAIRTILRERGISTNPRVFVSFVVYNYNVHELQDFLDFAENDLEADVVMIRPLSELGTDAGAVEDLRDLPPYEGDVRDALDAAAEYLADTERRFNPNTAMSCEIRLDTTTFRNVRPDPTDEVIMPYGFEDRVLAPRRGGWTSRADAATARWHLNTVRLDCPAGAGETAILESTFTPVNPNRVLSFRARAEVERGGLRLAVVDRAGHTLGSAALSARDGWQDIAFDIDTGANTAVAFVLSGAPDGLAATVDFLRLRTPGAGIREDFKLPAPRRWMIDTPRATARWNGHRLSLGYTGPRGPYLFKSYGSPCAAHARIGLPVRLDVRSGTLVIGVLSEDYQSWLAQFSFGPGRHKPVLEFDTGDNRKVQIVLFSGAEGTLDAVVDWGDCLEAPPERETGGPAAPESFEVEAPDADVGYSAAASLDGARRAGTPSRKVRFYCQKPWTDLNNFSVDGRMDVCCIATGASQPEYALGNILNQDFQQVWNGETARRFRRTVNGENPLPPCARCPMAYAYQGLFFDRERTRAIIQRFFHSGPFESARPGKHANAVLNGMANGVIRFMDAVHFKDFRAR